MIGRALPAAMCLLVCVFLGGAAAAQDGPGTLSVPGLSPDTPKLALPPCENTQDDDNCARLLACVGQDGLWLDGQARGWNTGTLAAQRSDGVVCAGTWAADQGPFGTGTARMECADGTTARAIYYSQDSLTGTAIGRGVDSTGRAIRAWSGQNVLKFLGDGDVNAAKLPCTDAAIPIS